MSQAPNDTPDTLGRVFECARIAVDNRGSDLTVLDVSKLTSYTDYFLLVSATSDRRVRTIAEAVRAEMKEKGVNAVGAEGLKGGGWALIDFGDWVVHVFYEEQRRFFDLEGLWSDAKRVKIPDDILADMDDSGDDY